MNQKTVYDLPTRLFHWLFSGLFLTTILIAKIIDDESPTFSYHMLAGMTLSFLVVLRIVWGFIGTRHARFSSFILAPKELVDYLKGVFTGSHKRWAGHNPASSWAGLSMMFFTLGLGLTGFLMTSGKKSELIEEVHEILSTAFIVVAALHIAGIVLHTLRHKEKIGLSMIHGMKSDIPEGEGIQSAKPMVALVAMCLVASFALTLFKNYDSNNQRLNLFGIQLILGEDEKGEHGEVGGHEEEDEDDHD